MNINFVYSLTVGLSFIVRFNVNLDSKQDYFLFNGDNSTAHLFRQNQTIKLFLQCNTSYRHFEMPNVTNQFTFEWKGYTINNKNMNIVSSKGDKLNGLTFDAYTFLSPILHFAEHRKEAIEIYHEPLVQCQDINYGFFVIIVFAVGVVLQLGIIGPKVFEHIIKSYRGFPQQLSVEEEPAYVEITPHL